MSSYQIGDQIGSNGVTYLSPGKNKGQIVATCKCGKIFSPYSGNLRSGKVKSCGCLSRQESHNLKPGSFVGSNGVVFLSNIPKEKGKNQKSTFVCPCCFDQFSSVFADVRNGKQKSCGCLGNKLTTQYSKTIEYQSYRGMKERCSSPKHNRWEFYGGKGVKVCDRWLEPKTQGFINFLADMGARPSLGHTLDRIDGEGNYCPENCRWADWYVQNRNKNLPEYQVGGLMLAKWEILLHFNLTKLQLDGLISHQHGGDLLPKLDLFEKC
jgi:hypothetical protein